jgi:hypothetical protein
VSDEFPNAGILVGQGVSDCGNGPGAEGMSPGSIPQELKQTIQFAALAARLRSCPDKKQTKLGVVMEFHGLPPIGQEQRRPMDGAQFHSPWVGNAGGELAP